MLIQIYQLYTRTFPKTWLYAVFLNGIICLFVVKEHCSQIILLCIVQQLPSSQGCLWYGVNIFSFSNSHVNPSACKCSCWEKSIRYSSISFSSSSHVAGTVSLPKISLTRSNSNWGERACGTEYYESLEQSQGSPVKQKSSLYTKR